MLRKLPFQAAAVLAFSILLLFVGAPPAHADTIATIDVNASFLTGPGLIVDSVTFPSTGPSFYVTGQFTFDEDTDAISSWDMTFLGPLGSTYDLSPQSGGIASGSCVGSTPCPFPTLVFPSFWQFDFADNNASFRMDTIYGTAVPLGPGETFQLCPTELTFYPGNPFSPVDSPQCSFTSEAFFDDQPGVIYTLPPGGPTSGTLTVTSLVSTPEPAESTLLLLGLVFLLALLTLRPRTAPTATAIFQ